MRVPSLTGLSELAEFLKTLAWIAAALFLAGVFVTLSLQALARWL